MIKADFQLDAKGLACPINNGDNLKNLAILTLELISLSAANHSNAKPATRIKMASTMVVFLFE